ncbi:MAG: hypothetical protein A3G33_05755 [Omnitrophica bacterium RIFCSPLOWO2_12_FULL_44_17]|uniref:Uncharacterized protein n=1 Tax=Candidatus Danuiimicrobium aquiferis TaxID=1801832 RepID=A0A1G1L367_9BACT|nr:MAG: hypothetical protein A3B72_08310 [Omnitrophica bacterium RIFCSPHIGHO2_02_FULL_45_28]OGW90502.1 MAG: hypothetical protein A3E74_07610 [Omnitrophica bacterium RIFCSPHIGHO2_12_FULL_44_12]OGW99576.1 MAG: hypothetical protein A3G33_05755 [Omnitrophica bacterium RIFCSPLOWO2_12_FULL_44_17]OGX03611.1 MAG: hypothetical protein A3J12_05510 [Omnitrophica bacterium RIFCSPLOWO2_02_FULL_44_11]
MNNKKQQQKINQEAGVTLVEVMIVCAIMSILSVFLVLLSKVSQTAQDVEFTSSGVHTDAKVTMQRIAQKVREAITRGTYPVDCDNNQDHCEFVIPSNSGDIHSGTKIITIQHDNANNRVTMQVDNGSEEVIGRNISSLTFICTPPDSECKEDGTIITIALTGSKSSQAGRTMISTLTSEVVLRN